MGRRGKDPGPSQDAVRAATILADAGAVAWEADPGMRRFRFVSEAGSRLLGHALERWTGEEGFWEDHLDPADRERVLAERREAVEAGRDHALSYRLEAADGRRPWLRDTARVVTLDDGTTVLRGLLVDATADHRAEQDLRASEARFRGFIENLSDVVYALDVSGRFTYCSPAIRSVSSYTAAEVLGVPFTDFVHPDDLPALADVFRRNLAGESAQVEFRVRDKGGEVRWVHASIQPVIEGGQVTSVTGVFSEITARKRTLEALYESEARYRELVEMSPDSIVVHREGRIVFANRAALDLAGAGKPADLLGRSSLELVHESSRPVAVARIRRMMETGEPAGRAEEVFLRLDGTSVDVEVMASPIVLHGQPSFLVIIHDVTERRRIQEEIQSLNAELEERVRERTSELVSANRELESFSYSVSHDLRAPLRVIEGFAKMFLEEYGGSLDEQGRTYIDRIHTTSTRMDHLIHDLLAFSRMSRASMTMEKVDLGRLAREIAEGLAQQDPDRAVNIDVADGLLVRGDAALLRIVVENLVGNAWKYTSRRPDARIEFGSEAADGETVYFVRDDGVGFDMRFAGKLFRPFQRLHALGDFEGTGIGLATVRRIIERHGGRVWAEGETERGATFRFTLPAPATRARDRRAGA